MAFYLILFTTFSVTISISFLFFLMNELKSYVNINSSSTTKKDDKEELQVQNKKDEIKYEDKYVTRVRNMNNNPLLKDNDKELEKILENYKNNIIIEKTPLGNVAMYYDSISETFTYYSDNAIPYRFLEVVARKYVINYNCKQLYIDMEQELEKKQLIDKELKDKKLKEMKEMKELKEIEFDKTDKSVKFENNNIDNSNSNKSEKKSVFTKFKSYNKEAGSGRVNSAPPPKNSIPSNPVKTNSNNSEECLLKDEANRYLCKGRFSNFNILQKVDRKKIDKKYALNFAEFKKKIIECN